MIGIQGENGLEEVTKSPCDTSLDANSTNAVENRVVTQAINEINSDLSDKLDRPTSVGPLNIPNQSSGIIYFNYPDGMNMFSTVISVKAYDGVNIEYTATPNWAVVQLYENNGVIRFTDIPTEYQGWSIFVVLV